MLHGLTDSTFVAGTMLVCFAFGIATDVPGICRVSMSASGDFISSFDEASMLVTIFVPYTGDVSLIETIGELQPTLSIRRLTGTVYPLVYMIDILNKYVNITYILYLYILFHSMYLTL